MLSHAVFRRNVKIEVRHDRTGVALGDEVVGNVGGKLRRDYSRIVLLPGEGNSGPGAELLFEGGGNLLR